MNLEECFVGIDVSKTELEIGVVPAQQFWAAAIELGQAGLPELVINPRQVRDIAAGEKPKVVIVACMRRLLTLLNGMIKTMTPWCDKTIQHA